MVCRWCGSEFIPRNSMQLNCSRTCKIRMDNFNAVNLTRKYKGLEKLTVEQYKAKLNAKYLTKCEWCGKSMESNNACKKYCSDDCRKQKQYLQSANIWRKKNGFEEYTIEQYKNRTHRNDGRNYSKKAEKIVTNPDDFNYCSCCGTQIRNYVRFAVCKTCYELKPNWYDSKAVDMKTERGLVMA